MKKINPDVLMSYFQKKRIESTGIILNIDDFFVIEIIMLKGPNIGFGINMEKNAFCFYDIEPLYRKNSKKRFKKVLSFYSFENKDFLINAILTFSN